MPQPLASSAYFFSFTIITAFVSRGSATSSIRGGYYGLVATPPIPDAPRVRSTGSSCSRSLSRLSPRACSR
jgi:hypothetical protein